MTNNSITIRAIATFKIQWPSSTCLEGVGTENSLRDTLEIIHRVSAFARVVMTNNGARFVQAIGFDVSENCAVARYAVPSTVNDDRLRASGDELTELFYRECGVMVESEKMRRKANDINGPLWTLELKEL